MPILLLILAGLGIFVVASGGVDMGGKYDLPDIAPDSQGGGFDETYDVFMESASESIGVPFALIKAHAIEESSLNPGAYKGEPATSTRPASASYGLMQVLWWPGSDRFKKYGYPDSALGMDGIVLYQPEVNIAIGAHIIKDNLGACRGVIRDAVNMYNTGVKEATREAPYNYDDKVLGYYSQIIGKEVS